jgi:hypothetical protein
MVVLPLSLTAEIIAGWLVDRSNWMDLTPNPSKHYEIALVTGRGHWQGYFHVIFVAPGLTIGVTQLTGIGIFTVCSSYLVFTIALIATFLGGFYMGDIPTQKND